MKKLVLIGIITTMLLISGIAIANNGKDNIGVVIPDKKTPTDKNVDIRVIADTISKKDIDFFKSKGCIVRHRLKDATSLDCSESMVGQLNVRESRIFHIMDLEADVQISADKVWAEGIDGSGITVAVLDTGVQANHVELSDSIVGCENFVAGEDCNDYNGHGTHVAGIITANGVYTIDSNKATGVAPGASVYMLKVCGEAGICWEDDMMAAMEYAVNKLDVKVMSISIGSGNFGSHCDGDPLAAKVNWVVNEGITVVVAAGNDGAGVSSPACASGAIAVGAVDKEGYVQHWSNYGSALDIVAPGVDVLSSYSCLAPGAEDCTKIWYAYMSGTSMATPHISGVAALLLQTKPSATVDEIKTAMDSTADPAAGCIECRLYWGGECYWQRIVTCSAEDEGAGVVNAYEAYQYIQSLAPECTVDADCSDGVSCTDNICVDGACVYTPNNAKCPADGWIGTGNTQWVSIGQCTEKEQEEQEYRDYYCDASLDCQFNVIDTQWIDTGTEGDKTNGTPCNDGLYCTVGDQCIAGACEGTERNCDDGEPCTTDSCNEGIDACEHTWPDCGISDGCCGPLCDYMNDIDCPSAPEVALEFYDDFEDGTLNKWIESGDMDWKADTVQAHTDRYSANGFDSDNPSYITIATSLDLTGCTDCTLTFWWYLKSLERNEYFAVDIYDGEWHEHVFYKTDGDDDSKWHETIIDLDANYIMTSEFKFRFKFKATGSYDDVWIDDVNVTSVKEPAGPACSSDADCNDANECTDDVCINPGAINAYCSNTAVVDGTSCDDGLFCNGVETCIVGVCQPETPIDCSAWSDQCNDGVCDDGLDQCIAQPKAGGTVCDDGLYCTVNDACSAGACEGFLRDCSAWSDQCNNGACNEATDSCVKEPANEGLVCNDGLYCNVGETCQSGVCTGGSVLDCSDGVACTVDSCDEASDSCFNTPNNTFCDNGFYCDGAETCDAILDCQSGTTIVCDDSNECTDNYCNEENDACEFINDNTNVCGFFRDCPADQCIGVNWTIYPADGHDYCQAGSCIIYSCSPISSYYDEACDVDWDNDGIVNSEDACPNLAGTDCNGCPNPCSGCAVMSCDVGSLNPPTCVAGTCSDTVCPADGCGVGTCALEEYGTYAAEPNVCEVTDNAGTCAENPCMLTCTPDPACEVPPTQEFTFTGTVPARGESSHTVAISSPGATNMYVKLTWSGWGDLRLRIYDPSGTLVSEIDKSGWGNKVEETTINNLGAGDWQVVAYSDRWWGSISYTIEGTVNY